MLRLAVYLHTLMKACASRGSNTLQLAYAYSCSIPTLVLLYFEDSRLMQAFGLGFFLFRESMLYLPTYSKFEKVSMLKKIRFLSLIFCEAARQMSQTALVVALTLFSEQCPERRQQSYKNIK